MKIRQQFRLQETMDPFTLLKISQAFREMAIDERLEFICTGGRAPKELFQVLPADAYEVVEEDVCERPRHCRIVIQKLKEMTVQSDAADSSCCCGEDG